MEKEEKKIGKIFEKKTPSPSSKDGLGKKLEKLINDKETTEKKK